MVELAAFQLAKTSNTVSNVSSVNIHIKDSLLLLIPQSVEPNLHWTPIYGLVWSSLYSGIFFFELLKLVIPQGHIA